MFRYLLVLISLFGLVPVSALDPRIEIGGRTLGERGDRHQAEQRDQDEQVSKHEPSGRHSGCLRYHRPRVSRIRLTGPGAQR